MNTFLPYPPEKAEIGLWSFRNSSEVLDNKRLNKQSLEASQILDVLCDKSQKARSYYHHPAVLMWQKYEWTLLEYLKDMCLECIENRHFKNSIYDNIYRFQGSIPLGRSADLPPWMGDKEFHASHRSRLLFKGRCDVLVQALKEYHKLKTWAQVKFWLVSNDCPFNVSDDVIKKDILTNVDADEVEAFLDKYHVVIPPNHYAQFKWEEKDNIPSVWPVTIEKLRSVAM